MTNVTLDKAKKTLLIVDDNQGILDVMRIMLEDAGYAVMTTVDGHAVQNLKEPLPDLLVLDILLSGTDGGELCTRLKSSEKTKHIPIIILSANREVEKISRTCGADGFLTKPFAMDELLDKIHVHTSQVSPVRNP